MEAKNRKRISVRIWIIIVGFLFLLAGFGDTKKDTYLEVVSRHGYSLDMIELPVPIQIPLKPEWLIEEGTWNVVLLEKANTSFILNETESSHGGLTFAISIQPKIERSMGTFLSNKVFEEDGGYHYYYRSPLWKIYSQDGRQLDIDVIAIGQGDKEFSFTLRKEEIADAMRTSRGLNIQFNGIVLYEYVQT